MIIYLEVKADVNIINTIIVVSKKNTNKIIFVNRFIFMCNRDVYKLDCYTFIYCTKYLFFTSYLPN